MDSGLEGGFNSVNNCGLRVGFWGFGLGVLGHYSIGSAHNFIVPAPGYLEQRCPFLPEQGTNPCPFSLIIQVP